MKELHPWNIWREEERENIKLGSTIGNWVSQYFLLVFPFYSLVKLIVCKVSSKLVTPDPRLQGCLILNNRTGDSIGNSILLWVSPIGTLLVFALILSVVCLSCLWFVV